MLGSCYVGRPEAWIPLIVGFGRTLCSCAIMDLPTHPSPPDPPISMQHVFGATLLARFLDTISQHALHSHCMLAFMDLAAGSVLRVRSTILMCFAMIFHSIGGCRFWRQTECRLVLTMAISCRPSIPCLTSVPSHPLALRG